jgi:hypothetical protein
MPSRLFQPLDSLSLPLQPKLVLSPSTLSDSEPVPSTSTEEDVPLNSAILPGYQESEEEASLLTETLDSLLPSHSVLGLTQPLSVVLGKKAVVSSSEIGSTSTQLVGKGGKAFSWSRGLASELSPVKTRSSRKKQISSSHSEDVCVPTSPVSGALRALKAQARAK